MPNYLGNCPHNEQAQCLANIASAKQFSITDVTTTDIQGAFILKSGDNSYSVNISGGHCSCPFFTKSNIPCKHMFAIFSLFPSAMVMA